MKAKILLLAVWLISVTGCITEEPYQPDLNSEHSIKVNIKVRLYVTPSGEKLYNVPVDISFYPIPMEIPIGVIRRVVSGKTDSNGEFNFNTVIDTTYFEHSNLHVRVPQLKNYICSLDKYSEYIDMRFFTFNEEELNNIDFEFYKKTSLTINLNRVQDDDFEIFYIYHHAGKLPNSRFYINNASDATNMALQFETAADIYTKITWGKKMGGEWHIEGTDSLICKQNKNNVFNINY